MDMSRTGTARLSAKAGGLATNQKLQDVNLNNLEMREKAPRREWGRSCGTPPSSLAAASELSMKWQQVERKVKTDFLLSQNAGKTWRRKQVCGSTKCWRHVTRPLLIMLGFKAVLGLRVCLQQDLSKTLTKLLEDDQWKKNGWQMDLRSISDLSFFYLWYAKNSIRLTKLERVLVAQHMCSLLPLPFRSFRVQCLIVIYLLRNSHCFGGYAKSRRSLRPSVRWLFSRRSSQNDLVRS